MYGKNYCSRLRETNLEKLKQGDEVLIYRSLSKDANFPVGYSVLDGSNNNFSAKFGDLERNGIQNANCAP